MMFLDPGDASGGVLAISQPAHAWVSGQLLRQWADDLPQPLLLAAEQHDLAWFDWERAPSFDPATGRPHLFRDVGAASRAPRWAEAVGSAFAAWGAHVALLISRHGSVIYTRFAGLHRSAADDVAAARYVEQQAPIQAAWARSLGLPDATLARQTDLIAFVDRLSLGMCGALPLPLELDGPGQVEGTARYRLARQPGETLALTLAPWPFRDDAVTVATSARALPGGRFASQAAMRAWSAEAVSRPLEFLLTRSAAGRGVDRRASASEGLRNA